MNGKDVEARLARWQPARPASELMRRLHDSVPPAQVNRRLLRCAGNRSGIWSWRPWPLAYAGLLVAWMLILALRLLTPSDPQPIARPVITQTHPAPAPTPALAATLAAERSFFLDRNNLDPL